MSAVHPVQYAVIERLYTHAYAGSLRERPAPDIGRAFLNYILGIHLHGKLTEAGCG